MTNRFDPGVDPALALRGPILVLGAGGFVGANLLRRLLRSRPDVTGTVRTPDSWRLQGIDSRVLRTADFNDSAGMAGLLATVKPATIFDCTAYGAYAFESDAANIYQTNLIALARLLEQLDKATLAAYIHAGSSSEYGSNCAAPAEEAPLAPNSHYAVSKAAASNLIALAGKTRALPVANLRLYAVYGPYEDSSRLIPAVIKAGLEKTYSPLVNPDISRDFVHVDDVCAAFIAAATHLTPALYGQSFNIGTGQRTTIREVAQVAHDVFGIAGTPSFGTMPNKAWDLTDWYADPRKAAQHLGWSARIGFRDGLASTAAWFKDLGPGTGQTMTKKPAADTPAVSPPGGRSITAVVACYKDEQAIPVMYERLVQTFKKINADYEIIFVNDGSPDDCAGAIQRISAIDPKVIGITHSRNFGSQMAFRSGMEIATKDACVLLDGDLQDPPHLIEQFHAKWLEGYDIVYGRRVKRDMPFLWELLYKAFYRVFSAFSYLTIPHDAGDFSLIDKRAVAWILQCPERDLFMRGLRAYVGFKQTGVDYIRPERMFGRTTNNLFRNIAWAKRGIFSFSDVPMSMLTAGGVALLGLSIVLGLAQAVLRLYAPELVPPGITTIILAILFFGSINVFAIGLVGEYVSKIMQEVKQRPRLIRAAMIRNGQTVPVPAPSKPPVQDLFGNA
jgi:polyisoprenyl-phosphate glycosyltransferase